MYHICVYAIYSLPTSNAFSYIVIIIIFILYNIYAYRFIKFVFSEKNACLRERVYETRFILFVFIYLISIGRGNKRVWKRSISTKEYYTRQTYGEYRYKYIMCYVYRYAGLFIFVTIILTLCLKYRKMQFYVYGRCEKNVILTCAILNCCRSASHTYTYHFALEPLTVLLGYF